MPDTLRLIPNVESSQTPTVPRARLLHQIIRSVNENTLRFTPPRNVHQDEISGRLASGVALQNPPIVENQDTGEPEYDTELNATTWQEIGRTTDTVRVTNPDNEDQYVDVLRIVTVTYLSSDGRIERRHYTNPSSE